MYHVLSLLTFTQSALERCVLVGLLFHVIPPRALPSFLVTSLSYQNTRIAWDPGNLGHQAHANYPVLSLNLFLTNQKLKTDHFSCTRDFFPGKTQLWVTPEALSLILRIKQTWMNQMKSVCVVVCVRLSGSVRTNGITCFSILPFMHHHESTSFLFCFSHEFQS